MMFKQQSAFSLLEVMIVVAVISLLAAIGIPSLRRANLAANQKACVNNLRLIDQATQQWAVESKANSGQVVTHSNLVPYLRPLPVCPTPSVSGGTFVLDYGMTFVKDPPFCKANNALEDSPHVFSPPPKTNSSTASATPAQPSQ